MQEQSPRRAIYAIVISMAVYVVGDTSLKLLGQRLPPSELVFWRNCIILISLAIAMIWTRPSFSARALLSWPVIGRCIFDCVNILCFTTAVVHMNMAELYAILQMSPFMMTILAIVFYGEPVGWRRWSAIVVGFCGVLLIIKPDTSGLNVWAVLGIVAALGAACRETITRRIDPSVSTLEATFFSALVTGASAFIYCYHEAWPALTHYDVWMIFIQAVAWLVGTLLLIHACRTAPLSIVASFRYSLLAWAALAGYLVFGDVPDILAVCGAIIIVLCGLYIFHREAVRRRTVASTVTGVN